MFFLLFFQFLIIVVKPQIFALNTIILILISKPITLVPMVLREDCF